MSNCMNIILDGIVYTAVKHFDKQDPVVKRGAVLKALTGQTKDNDYLLVRETTNVFGKAHDGSSVGAAKSAYNLVNLTNGKTRVDSPVRKFYTEFEDIKLSELEKHFGITFTVMADNVGRLWQ